MPKKKQDNKLNCVEKPCTSCGQWLLPTRLGWLCDNPACRMQYGVIVIREPGQDHVHKAMTEQLGEVSYRFHDYVNDTARVIEDYASQAHAAERKMKRDAALITYLRQKAHSLNRLQNLLDFGWTTRLHMCYQILFHRTFYLGLLPPKRDNKKGD
jgi:hypothetical protein